MGRGSWRCQSWISQVSKGPPNPNVYAASLLQPPIFSTECKAMKINWLYIWTHWQAHYVDYSIPWPSWQWPSRIFLSVHLDSLHIDKFRDTSYFMFYIFFITLAILEYDTLYLWFTNQCQTYIYIYYLRD